jgi:hypothetical protein
MHQHPAFEVLPATELRVTGVASPSVIGVAFLEGVAPEQFARVITRFH